jgi:hypothetical protein
MGPQAAPNPRSLRERLTPMPIELTDRGTLILPIRSEPLDLPETFHIGRVGLVRKAELHVTVFNYPIGKLVKKLGKTREGLAELIEGEARKTAWAFSSTGALVHLVQETPRPLQTLVALLDAPALPAFFDAIRAEILAHPGPDAAELADALTRPPPPHVTLFTSDPDGKAGIGLNTAAALDEAARRSRGDAGVPAALAAFAIHPSALAFAGARLEVAE